MAALDVPRTGEGRTGDALLPALVSIDAVFLALMSIAQRTGVPLAVRRGTRRRSPLGKVNTGGALDAHAGNQNSQLASALQQLGEQLSGAQGKLIQLTTIGLEHVPEPHFAAFYDMLSQMLRNAIEHGIEAPARAPAARIPAARSAGRIPAPPGRSFGIEFPGRRRRAGCGTNRAGGRRQRADRRRTPPWSTIAARLRP